MKRANDPIFWLPFGAGGVLAALFGPALVLITGFAAPFAIGLSPDALGYENMMAFAHNAIGKLFIFGLCVVVRDDVLHALLVPTRRESLFSHFLFLVCRRR